MKERIIQIFEDSTGIPKDSYTLESNLKYDLGLDSLDVIDLILNCEKEFGIIIPDDEVVLMDTLQDLINYIEEHCE